MRKRVVTKSNGIGIRLKSGFARSTNLKIDFEEQNSLDHLIISEKFQKHFVKLAKEVTNTDSKSRVHVISGTPGVGKSTFALFLTRFLSATNRAKLLKSVNGNKALGVDFKNTVAQVEGSKLLPVFLSGDEGQIEDAFAAALVEALKGAGLADLAREMSVVDAKASLEVIKAWEKSYPKRLKEMSALVGKVMPFKEFHAELKRGKRTALKLFADSYAEITGGAGHVQSKTGVVGQYKYVAQALSKKGFTGLIVVYDEFGKFLERGVRHPSTFDLHFLQEFAEACNASGSKQLHLLLLSHLPISRYAASLPSSVQQEWAKIEGRFSQLSFNDHQASTYTLIANVFEYGIADLNPKVAKSYAKNAEAWVQGIKRAGCLPTLLSTPELVDTLVACYPLHPSVVAILPLLAERVAQNERTMFSFLTRNEDYSLPAHLLSFATVNEMEMLRPETLYSYFRPLFANDLGVGGASRINIVAEQLLNSLEREDRLGRDLVCSLSSIAIINNRSVIKATKKSLVGLLDGLYSPSEIGSKLDDLNARRMIVFDRTNDEYSLFEGASVDIRSEIQKLRAKKLTPQAYVEILRSNLGLKFVVPKKYNFSKRITRFLTEQLVSADDLESRSFGEVDYSKEDGKVVFVAAFSKADIERAKEILKKETSLSTIFVVPNKPLDIESDLLELNAIERLYSKKELLSSGLNVRKELDQYQKISRKAIYRSCEILKSYNNMNATLFCGGKQHRKAIQCEFEISEFASSVMDEVFSSYPIFNNEMINKRKVSTPIIQGRMRLMAAVDKSDTKNWGIEGYGPELSILKSLMADNKIRFVKNESGNVERIEIAPTSALAPLLKGFHEQLKSANGPVVLADVLSRWVAPPFGIRIGLASLYLFLLSKAGKTPLSFYHEDTFLATLDVELFESIVKQPKRYSVQMVEMTPKLATYLKKLIAIPRAYLGGASSERDAEFVSVAKYYSQFYSAIPEYSRRSSQLSTRQRRLVASLDSFKQPEQFFLTTIPEIYCNDVWKNLSDSQGESLHTELGADLDQLHKMYADLLRSVSKSQRKALLRLYRAFGKPDIEIPEARAPLASLWRELAAILPADLKSFAFNSAAGRLIHRALQLEPTADNQRVIETLADAITGATPRTWDEKGKTLFELNLHQATNEIVQIGLFLSEDGGRQCTFLTSSKDDGTPLTAEVVTSAEVSPAMSAVADELKRLSSDLTKAEMNKVLIDLLMDLNNVRSRMISEDDELPGANWG